MRLSVASNVLIALFCAPAARGFLAPSHHHVASSLSMISAAEEAAMRAGAGAAAMKPVPPPKLFEDDLLDDMQQCLLKLEKRVQEGPGALSMLEVEEFQHATRRILDEMKLNEHNRPKPAPAFPAEAAPAAATPAAPAQTAPAAPQQQQTTTSNIADDQRNYHNGIDTSNDEGPAYDGTGGMGQAKGTVNTYVIPGMDEMSPEEYQTALQKSIIDRQAKRQATGNYGNRGSSDYLNNLSEGTSGTGMVKKD